MKHITFLFFLLLFFLFDFSNAQTFQSAAPLKMRRVDHESQLMNNGKVLAFGGYNGYQFNMYFYRSAEIYDRVTDTWSYTDSMAVARTDFSSVILHDGTVMAIGGRNYVEAALSSCELYNPVTGKWTAAASMNMGRSYTNAVLLKNGNVLVTGRENATCELYDVATKKWTYGNPMIYLHGFGSTMISLSDGSVLAFGGNGALTNAERYDPVTGEWKACGNLSAACQFSNAVLLPDGTVLIYGSAFGNGDVCFLFNPSTNTFKTAGKLNVGRMDVPGMLLDNGQVLTYGIGDLSTPTDIKAMEVYDPVLDAWHVAPYILPGNYGYTIHKLFSGEVLIVGGNFTTGNGSSKDCLLIHPEEANGCAAPNGTLSVGTSVPAICYGKNGTVTVANSQPGVNYKAMINNATIGNAVTGNGATINLSIPYNFLSTGKNIIQVSASFTGCNAIILNDTAQLTVNRNNVIKPKVVTNGALVSCNPAPVTLSSSVASTGYLWSTGATTSSIGAATTGYYYVILKDANGCLGYPSDTVLVKKLDASIPIKVDTNMLLCANHAPVQLHATPVDGVWSGVGITAGGLFSPAAVPADGIYNMVYTYCDKTDTTKIEVNSQPAETGFKIKTSKEYVCYQYDVDISCFKTNPKALYQLTINNRTFSDQTGTNISWNSIFIEDTINYITVKEILSNDCGTRITEKKDTIYLAPNPNLYLDVKADTLCSGNIPEVSIYNTEPNSKYYLFSQDKNIRCSDIFAGNGGELKIKMYYPVYENHDFTVLVISQYGCTLQLKDDPMLYVKKKSVDFEVSLPGGVPGDLFTLKNTSTSSSDSYKWNIDGTISTVTNPGPVSFTMPGVKKIILTGNNNSTGCLETMTRTVDIVKVATKAPGIACEYDTLPKVNYGIKDFGSNVVREKPIYAFHVDKDGNRYISEAARFTNGPIYQGAYGVSLKKYDKNNKLLWEKKHDTYNSAYDANFVSNFIVDIESDNSGNIYIAGHFNGNYWKWDNMEIKSPLFPTYVFSIAYIMKLNAQGVVQWMVNSREDYQGYSSNSFTDIVYVNDNTIYATLTRPSVMYFADGTGQDFDAPCDIGVIQIDKDGKFKKKFKSERTFDPYLLTLYTPDTSHYVPAVVASLSPKMAVTSTGKIVLVGKSHGMIPFGDLKYDSPSERFTEFMAVLDTLNGWEKVKTLYSYVPSKYDLTHNENQVAPLFALDKTDNIYLSEFVTANDNRDVINGTKRGFTAKYDLDGNLKWMDSTTFINGKGMVSTEKEIIVYGNYSTFYSAGPTVADRVGMRSKGLNDAIITSYSFDGKVNWLETVASDSADYGYLLAKQRCADNVYFTGGLKHSSSFMTKSITTNTPRCFIAKYAASGDCTSQNCNDCAGYLNGYAFLDSCRICAGGKTGITPILDVTKCKTTGIDQDVHASEISVYPNPAADQLTITSMDVISEISIRNMIGEVVFTKLLNNITNYTIDISRLPAAVYIITVKAKGTEFNRKVLFIK